MKKIVIAVRPDGQAEVDAQGFTGAECKDATRAIEAALGRTTEDAKKPEYSRQQARTSQEAKQR